MSKLFDNFFTSFRTYKILILVLALIFLFITSKFYLDKAFSFHFVDEEENMVIAHYMISGQRLYGDIFSNHQPLTYVFSEFTQKYTHPANLLLLIKRHREIVIIWSVVWSLFLIWRFGLVLFYFVAIYELSKIFLLVNLFLAESFSVYPLVYLISLVLMKGDINGLWEVYFSAIAFFLVWFFLLPLWPLMLFLALALFRKFEFIKKQMILFSAVVIGGTALMSIFLSWNDYFRDTIYSTIFYFMPVAPSDHMPKSLWEAFLAPFLTFTSPLNSQSLLIMRALSLLLIVNIFLLIKRGRYKFVFILAVILWLSDLRYYQPGSQYYEGFHLLPWFSILALLTGISSFHLFPLLRGKLRSFIIALLIISVGVTFYSTNLFKRVDQKRDFYVNYSRQYDMGEAVKIMEGGGDSLFVVPDEWLIYWQSNAKHPIKTLGYYAWMSNYPYLNEMVLNMFNNNPPTFLYCNCLGSGIENYFYKYKELKHYNGKTGLYVLPGKLDLLTKTQKANLLDNGFEI